MENKTVKRVLQAYLGSWIFFYEPKNPNLKNLKKLEKK